MDIRIEKKKGIRALFTKKGIPYLAGALFLVFVLWLLLRDNSSMLRVDARTISVGQVVSGEFNDYIRVTGQVQPITTVQLSPLEAGIVERLVVEEGTSVKKGDVLVVLSNTSLTLEILNSEAELAEKQNILRNTLISMEQEKLSLRQDKAQLDLDVSRKKRAWQQNEELYRNALIAREVGMGYTWFRRVFREYVGMAPAQYQHTMRLNKARELLATTAHSISEIAYALGFESVSAFSLFFRLRERLSPSQYRARFRGGKGQ